ncbi:MULTISPECIES: DUF4407 domain-containing protein [Frankia]|uniref:DUF4407 domain-containing protein n=1 Tax=Frankia alni (strain DSM 45986 / CECT 9034 / ACN14a) TaxID=326424 RepID=Q0RTC8_FRAAA|nr:MULTISPECIES: DUF4407 domain-containing protein [Frankia]CAJ59173.1 hypothetical protein; putative membrane protein [Frankia alni ACN14a]
MAPQDRPRFVTAGALMLLTAGLATYAGATVAAMGLHRSTLGAVPFGLFYATVIFFIDRSVLLSTRPYRYGPGGTVRVGRAGPSTAMRIFIAVCAALLVGETLLLRIFAPSIAPRVTQIRQEDLGRVLRGWDANQLGEQRVLRDDLAARQRALDSAHALVTGKTAEVNCQLTGGDGCLSGEGAVYRIKLGELGAATAAVTTATGQRDAAQARLDVFDQSRDARRAHFRDQQTATVDAADDLLIREKAFWRLTAADHSVLLWRTVLTLLLLGIDLGPLMFKRTLEQTELRRRERLVQWQGETTDEVDAQQIGQTARRRGELAEALAEGAAARYGQYVRRRDEIGTSLRVAADLADADVGREQIRIDRDSRIRDLRVRYRVPDPAPAPDPADRAHRATPS